MTLFGITFLSPWAFLLPIIITALYIYKKKTQETNTIYLPENLFFKDTPSSLGLFLTTKLSQFITLLLILALTLGAARPAEIIDNHLDTGRNVMLVVDVSPSMKANDFIDHFTSISRMQGVKKVVREFIESRTQDKIGLVVFGGRSFLQSPLTKDHRFLLDAIDALQPGIAGDGTAMGDALGAGLKRLQNLPNESKTIVIVTDGASNAGRILPITAAEISKKLSIKVHTIGVGGNDDSEAPYDGSTLNEIAKITGGIYRNASDVSALRLVTDEIQKLIETESKSDSSKTIKDYSWIPGASSLFFISLLIMIRTMLFPVRWQRGTV
jgi:Ca-activated chloride channel family protein